MTRSALRDDQWANWGDRGWVRITEAVPASTIAELRLGVDELTTWAERGSPGLHHFEQTARGRVIARSEHFADAHPTLGSFIRGDLVLGVLRELFGDEPLLFKEKVNYKHSGGGGFAPHQDAAAYRFVDHHISVLVPLDPMTVASGCLWFATERRRGPIPADRRGRIPEDVVASMSWEPIEAELGDVVFFDSYAPHRSESNTTDRPRRALYVTYNAARHGDHREEYYRDKLAEFAREGDSFDGERARISVSDDFLGRSVT